MSMNNGTILAIGAAGPNAGLVVAALAERGARVRAFIRKPEEERLVRSSGAAEVAIGDLRDRESLLQAMRGAYTPSPGRLRHASAGSTTAMSPKPQRSR